MIFAFLNLTKLCRLIKTQIQVCIAMVILLISFFWYLSLKIKLAYRTKMTGRCMVRNVTLLVTVTPNMINHNQFPKHYKKRLYP